MAKLILKNINWTLTASDLVKYFSKYGTIVELRRLYNLTTGKPKGYGFVFFKDQESAEKALNSSHRFFNREMILYREFKKDKF